MRPYKKDLVILLGLLFLGLIIWILTPGQSTIDLQFHDTYFIIDKISITILILGPLTMLIFLARGLMRKFKSIGANAGLIIGLILVSLITYRVVEIQMNYLNEIKRLDDEGLPDRGQFYLDIKNSINWTWGLFGLWIAIVMILGIQTVRLLKEWYASQQKL
jgi:hypothetical protein